MNSIENKLYINDGNDKLLSLITKKNIRVLDIGCGGGNARILYQANHTLDGITISEKEKEENSAFFRSIVIHNIEQGLPSEFIENTYDYVLCSHVLEHICYPEKILNDIKNVLSDDGLLIVALPNIMHYKSRLSLIAGNFDYQETGIWDYTHFKWYTFKSARQLLERHSYRVIHEIADGELPLNSIFSKVLPHRLRKALYTLLTKLSKGLFGYQMILVASK